MMKITASKPPPTKVDVIHLMKRLFLYFSFNNTITFALTSDPVRYDRKLAISTRNVDPKTTEYASAFSKNGGTGMIMLIETDYGNKIHEKSKQNYPSCLLIAVDFGQNIIYNINYWKYYDA